jgi:putative heme transporter
MRRLQIEIGAKTFLFALGVIAAVWLLVQLWPVLLVVAIALMIVGMVNPAIHWFEDHRIRRPYAIAIVFGALFASIILFAAITFPRVVAEIGNLAVRLPELQQTTASKLEGSRLGGPLARAIKGTGSSHVLEEGAKLVVAYTPRVVEIVAYGLSAVFLALYLVIDRDRMRGALFAVVPRSFHVRTSRVLLNLETIVGGYLRGQLLTSLLMGIFTFGVLTIAGVPNAIALSLFAAVADVLPYIGALLACGPAVLAAMEKGTTTTLIVLAVLAAYQELESRAIVPRVYGRALRLPASVVLVALLVGMRLLGILGAILALPVASAIRMLIMELRVHLPGEDVTDAAVRARDEAAEELFEKRAAGVPAAEAAVIATEIAKATSEKQPIDQPITGGLKPRTT